MPLNLNKLLTNRSEIFKAEIGALLFNLGKTHIGFWREKKDERGNKIIYLNVDEDAFETQFGYKPFSTYKDYYSESIFEQELEKVSFQLKNFIKENQVNLIFIQNSNKQKIPWIEFFKGVASEKEFIKKIFFRGCENINSGIDKGAPKEQLKGKLWIANAFGSLKKEVEFNDFDQARICFFQRLHCFLEEKGYYQNPDWKEIRNFVLENVRSWYSRLLSDSSFPINDVTLWDQAYMTATMFKAVLAELFLEDSGSKFNTYIRNPISIRWRILGVQYDKLGMAEKGYKIASIKWYREAVKEIDEKVKLLLECKYPIGNEIYRDETGIYFLVGESLGKDLNDGSNLASLKEELKEVKEEIYKIFEDVLKGEVFPTILFTKPSRGLMNLGYLIEKAKENFLRRECLSLPQIRISQNEENEQNKAIGICPICKIRLIYESDKEKKNSPVICEECDRRIHHRQVKRWQDNLEGETIWTSEIKDKNERIALITLKFELKEWLNGDWLNRLVIREENYDEYMDVIQSIFKILKNKFQINNMSKLSISQDEENNLKNFLKLFDEKGVQDPFNKVVNKLKSSGEIGQIDRDFQNLAERLIISEEIKNFNFIQNKNENELHKLNVNINSNSNKINIFQKHDNKVKINKDIKDKLWIIFALNYIYLQIKNLLLERSIGDRWEEFIKNNLSNSSAIDFDKRKIYWNKLTDKDIEFLATLVLQFLLRKNPSPARLRRIWETTREFFESLQDKLLDEIIKMPKWRRKRLVFENIEVIPGTLDKEKEFEGKGLFFWAVPEGENRARVYLITSILDFLERFGDNELKRAIKEYKESQRNEKLDEILSSEEKLKKHLLLDKFDKLEITEYFEDNSRSNLKIDINLKSFRFIEYKPYLSIIDPTPVSWQFAIPAEFLPAFMKKIKEEYERNFKWVYGKLPLHIGIIIQDYDKPLYIGIKALRKIRRDLEKFDTLKTPISATSLKAIQKELYSKYATPEEVANNTENYYSLYEWNGEGESYRFYLKPNENSLKWIATTNDKENKTFYIYSNTFDFEFLDSNVRRNEIFYNGIKRVLSIKSNRCYFLEDWKKFVTFKNIFKDKCSKLHKLISVIYRCLEDWNDTDEASIRKFLTTSFINILELKKKENKSLINELCEILEMTLEEDREDGKISFNQFQEELQKKINKETMKMFIDMFKLWHTALGEV